MVKLIGLITVVMSKVIVEPSHASTMAWRKLPAPLSRLMTTTGSVVQKGAVAVTLEALAGAAEEAVAPTRIVTPKAASSNNVIVGVEKTRRGRKQANLNFFIIWGKAGPFRI